MTNSEVINHTYAPQKSTHHACCSRVCILHWETNMYPILHRSTLMTFCCFTLYIPDKGSDYSNLKILLCMTQSLCFSHFVYLPLTHGHSELHWEKKHIPNSYYLRTRNKHPAHWCDTENPFYVSIFQKNIGENNRKQSEEGLRSNSMQIVS